MPTILRQEGLRLYFYSHEPNEPPHVHIERGDAAAKVWLTPVELARNQGFRTHELGTTLNLVREHRETCLEAWHGHFGDRGR